MTTVLFHAVPLTPIHIGDGTTLCPEEFVIRGDALVCFDATLVIASMRPEARTRFLAALDRGELKAAQAELHKGAQKEHEIERIAIGPHSKKELSKAIADPAQRKGLASMFIRTANQPYVPGSSLKGAFRTALIDAFAHDEQHHARVESALGHKVRSLPASQKATGDLSNALQHLALDCPPGETERDPLRWLSISDGLLPRHGTRVDQVSVGWKDGQAPKMQLHVERLRSFADQTGATIASFPVTLSVTDRERQRLVRKLDP